MASLWSDFWVFLEYDFGVECRRLLQSFQPTKNSLDWLVVECNDNYRLRNAICRFLGTNLGYSKPARLTTSCDRVVHNIIKNKKICLELQGFEKIRIHEDFILFTNPLSRLIRCVVLLMTYPFNTPTKNTGKKDFIFSQFLPFFQ